MALELVKVIRNVRWQYNRPANGQANCWTSFDIAVAKDEKGGLFWGASVFHDKYILDNVRFYPVPNGITEQNLDELVRREQDAPWLGKAA